MEEGGQGRSDNGERGAEREMKKVVYETGIHIFGF